jgi:hypothetical protein
VSASNHLNKSLFHGSSHTFEVGDVVSPEHDVWGEGEVHATNNPLFASTFGDHVYEVSALDEPKMIQEDDEGRQHWVSKAGFTVKKQVY